MRITSPAILAQALHASRKEHDLTQKAVADTVGIKQSTVSSFENSPDKARLETLFKLLAALDLELHLAKRGSKTDEASAWDQEW